MKGIDSVFDSIDGMHYKYYKIILNLSGCYIDSSTWIKNKNVIINSKIKHGNCFQYAVKFALNLDNIVEDPQRISKIKSFIM